MSKGPLVVTVARKPLSEGSVAANVLEHGTGAINIDGSRIGTEGGTVSDPASAPNFKNRVYNKGMGGLRVKRPSKSLPGDERSLKGQGMFAPGKEHISEGPHPMGRWPANVVLSVPAALALDTEVGATKASEPRPMRRGATSGRSIGSEATYGTAKPHESLVGYGDEGGPSRYFRVIKDEG